jgi:AraC-like DNA-binding protein
MQPLDTIVFETPLVRAARFRCSAQDPRFRDSGPAENCAVVFPRTAVWIQYSGSRSFVADPSLATIYNPGQEYTRRPISGDGDRCEWFGVSPVLALEIATQADPHACDRYERPFAAEHVSVDRSLYLRQRELFKRLESGNIDQLEAEESIIEIVSSVIAGTVDKGIRKPSADNESQMDLVQRAKASLLVYLFSTQSLNDLASELNVSAYHLCRVCRKHAGRTLHEFKTDLRLRTSLELLEENRADLSRLALDCGFSSHSHFTAAMRARFGFTPSALRERLTA